MSDKREWKLAPGTITSRDNPFLIDAASWHAINAYVYTGTQLPDMKETDINNAYRSIRQHTKKWRDETFDKTLKVADDIVAYGTSAPRYYQALWDAGKQMEATDDGNPEYETAKKRFLAVADRLAKEAAAHETTADNVKQLVLEFRGQTTDDYIIVKKLHEEYQRKYGEGSAAAQKLATDIKDLQNAIEALKDEYNQAVAIAATTPTYAWIYPFGTIPAVIVAGVYGDRAVKLKNQIDRTNQRLGELRAEERERTTKLAALDLAQKSLQGIETKMPQAIDALDKAANCWHAVAADIKKVRELAAGMKGEFALYFVDIPQAIDDWKRIAEKADAYRAHAFIQIQSAAAA
jgi:chromosome segregation ATPase